MARVWNEGNTEHSGPGEAEMFQLLKKGLPDSFVLINNITIPFPDGDAEIDIIAIGPDVVFLIEVKTRRGHLVIEEQVLYKDGVPEEGPFAKTCLKAKKLKSRLIKDWSEEDASKIWVEPIVLIARPFDATKIERVDSMRHKIVFDDEIIGLICPPSPLCPPKRHGQISSMNQTIVDKTVGGARPPKLKRTVGDYVVDGRIMLLPDGLSERLSAHHALTGAEVFLEVLKNETLSALRKQLMQQMPPHPSLLMPHHSFENDGMSVFVTSQRQGTKLQTEIDQLKAGQHKDSFTPKNWSRIFADCVAVANHYEHQGFVFTDEIEKSLKIDANDVGFLELREIGPKAIDPLKTRLVLAGIAKKLLEVTNDALLKEAISSLEAGPEKGPTLESIVARLRLEIDPSTPAHSTRDILSRFTDRSVLRRHKHGETLLAYDSLNKTQVVVKYERDRDGQSWTDRESRLLNHIYDRVAGFVPRPVASDRSGGMSYLAVVSFDSERLSDLIDGGYFISLSQIIGIADQLLVILESMHPDIATIRKILETSGSELSHELAEEIGNLRDSGISHNHICPSNILVGADGQVMLIDFVRAGRMGELTPERSLTLWPSELPSDVCDPRADIYCVAKILETMIQHLSDSSSDQPLISQIEEIAQRVMRLAVTSEFLTAAEFRMALGDVVVLDQVLKLETFQPSDTLLRIKALIAQGDYRGALSICPTDWNETYREIESKIQLAEFEGVRVCNIGDVELSYIGEVAVASGTTSLNKPFVNGMAQCYRVNVANRCVLEVRQTTATDVEGTTSSWVGVESSIGEVGYLKDVVRSKRMSVLYDNGQAFIQLGQAQLVEKNGGFATSVKQVDLAQLSAPCGEVDALQLLADFGALATDTREILFGETNNKRKFLATSFSEDSLHLAAVAHLIARIIPIYRGPNVQ